jgi:hypothetical protein
MSVLWQQILGGVSLSLYNSYTYTHTYIHTFIKTHFFIIYFNHIIFPHVGTFNFTSPFNNFNTLKQNQVKKVLIFIVFNGVSSTFFKTFLFSPS